jgi:hypothetical protein
MIGCIELHCAVIGCAELRCAVIGCAELRCAVIGCAELRCAVIPRSARNDGANEEEGGLAPANSPFSTPLSQGVALRY